MDEWTVTENGNLLLSEDFTHDAMLRLDGDFSSDEQRLQYANSLAAKLNATQPAALREDVESFVNTLRGFSMAYPVSMFGPVTDEEIKQHSNLITRNSAAMGRHCAQFMTRAADMIESLAASPTGDEKDSVRVPREFLERWTSRGLLQTYENRECFREEAFAMLAAAPREPQEG